MYNYTFANIFLYCYEHKINFSKLLDRIAAKKEKEYLEMLPIL